MSLQAGRTLAAITATRSGFVLEARQNAPVNDAIGGSARPSDDIALNPPKTLLGRSGLQGHIHCVATALYVVQIVPVILGQPFAAHGPVEPFDAGILLRPARLDIFERYAP